jgi:hypothetical protein
MKSIEEIEKILVDELVESINKNDIKSNNGYYNESYGDTSFLLAKLIELQLKKKYNDWNESDRWLDDCLLTKIYFLNHRFFIWGIMIWGIDNTTSQWTDPFYFELELNDAFNDFSEYVICFKDLNTKEISYEDFRNNRSYWNQKKYESWNASEKNWAYKIVG